MQGRILKGADSCLKIALLGSVLKLSCTHSRPSGLVLCIYSS